MTTTERSFGLWALAGLLGFASASLPARGAEPVDVFSFGQAELSSRLTNQFHFRNGGEDLLAVTSATPSCECVQVLRWTPYVEPGATGTVEVLFIPDQAGTVDYRVHLQTSSAEQPVIELAVRGDVQAPAPARTDRDWSLYLAAGDVEAALRGASDAVWVDVRREEDYQRVRIPGSIQIPLFAIKTKEFLRSRRVVLVDDGLGSPATEEECRRLRAMGFGDVGLWYGGLNAWRQLGGSLEELQPAALDHVLPAAVKDILPKTDWLVAVVGAPAGSLGPDAVALAGNPDDPVRLGDELRQAMAAHPQALCLLIATAAGDDYAQLADAVGSVDAHVFYLEGGLAAWTAYQQMMGAVQQGGRLATQTRTVAGGAPRKGCGGCPK